MKKGALNFRLAALFTAGVLLFAACRPRVEQGKSGATAGPGRGVAVSETGSGKNINDGGSSGSGSGKGEISAGGSGHSSEPVVTKLSGFDVHLRVKNLPQLRHAIDACFGPDLTFVTAEMILPANGTIPPADPVTGRFAFLNSSRYTPGVDALAVEGAFLLDPNRGERYGADADQISAPYLRALETIANVVAFNCTQTNSHCDCSAADKSAAILARCLPAFDPATQQFQGASAAFSDACKGGEIGLKTAVASLIASYAFAAKN